MLTAISTVFGKRDHQKALGSFLRTESIFALNAYYLSGAIVHTANGASELFYWNKKEAYTLLQVAGHQLPGGLPRDGFVSRAS